MKNFSKLKCLTIPHRLYVQLESQLISSLKSLTLIFTIYQPSISSPSTGMRYILTANRILTNVLILKLVQTLSSSSPDIQTLTLIVSDSRGFDTQLSEWLKTNFLNKQDILYDLLMHDKIIRFYF